MENQGYAPEKKFSSPEEEINFLKSRLEERERTLERGGIKFPEGESAKKVVNEYSKTTKGEVLAPDFQLSEETIGKIVLELKPEEHDRQVEEMLGILREKGIKNALSVLEGMDNPHLDDDFHRFLVQYLTVEGISGVEKNKDLFKALNMRLYEIILPEVNFGETVDFKKLISLMEQFYAGMLSISDGRDKEIGKNHFTLEIALSNASDEVIFYAGMPKERSDLLEKQLLALYPDARLRELKDDYNVFNPSGGSVGAYASLSDSQVFPIKTFESFESDPLAVLLNVFSKLKKEGEGASIQITILPAGDYFLKKYGVILDQIKKGTSVKKATNISWGLGGAFTEAVKDLAFGGKKKDSKEEDKKIDETAIKNISAKIESTILNSNIRVVASALSQERAEEILGDIESAFNQFALPGSNRIVFEKEKKRSSLKNLFHEFSYRLFSYDHPLPLNIRELSSIFHFPAGLGRSPQLKQSRFNVAPAPLEMGSEGTLIGINRFRGKDTRIFLTKEDRMRHFYAIGQTGTGKTTLLKNMIIQDIRAGHGVCMIDPHGTDIEEVLKNIPEDRLRDVIYFDPAEVTRPMGLNMLEYDPRFPEQKTFVVNELLAIFNKLFDMKVAGGPSFEQYFRNTAMLVMEHPESGNTLLDLGRVLSDRNYRELKLQNCKNPLILQFWQNAVKSTGEQSLANYVPYITNKFDIFLSNDIMRPIVAQEKSSFNFRDIMDNKKILLINLSKGRLGDINSSLLGLVIVGKLLMAAFSRVDSIGVKEVPDFYLYIDEFQNVTTDSIATILSEARKYRLSLNIAHQYIKQLEDGIKNAVFGNVGSMAVFRVGSEDAEFLGKQLEPVFSPHDIINLENYNSCAKILVRGTPTKPFSMEILPPEKGDERLSQKMKLMSVERYGRPRAEIEEEILNKYKINNAEESK